MEYVKQNKFYQADRINDHVLRISGMGGECDIVYSKDRIFGKKGKAVLPGELYIDG